MKSFKSLKTISLLLLLCGAAAAQGGGGSRASNPNEDAERQGTAHIQGRVVLPNGSPVSRHVKVTLRVLRGEKAVVYTDTEGLFDIGNLTPGSYTLEIEPD